MSSGHGGALERAYQGVSGLIAAGVFKPGARLRESELAKMLDVSRTPIREALRQLAAEGHVEMQPNRGAVLVGFSGEDLQSLSLLRQHLEPLAVRLAVPLLTEADLTDLGELVDAMRQAAQEANLEKVGELNDLFHSIFLMRSGNRLLASAVTGITRPSIVRRTFHLYTQRELERSMAHHFEIYEAAVAGDANWAEAAMRVHMLAGRRTVMSMAAS